MAGEDRDQGAPSQQKCGQRFWDLHEKWLPKPKGSGFRFASLHLNSRFHAAMVARVWLNICE